MDKDQPISNRDKKIEGRHKRRRFVQGTRAYTHAMTNSIAKRAGKKTGDGELPGDERQDSRG